MSESKDNKKGDTSHKDDSSDKSKEHPLFQIAADVVSATTTPKEKKEKPKPSQLSVRACGKNGEFTLFFTLLDKEGHRPLADKQILVFNRSQGSCLRPDRTDQDGFTEQAVQFTERECVFAFQVLGTNIHTWKTLYNEEAEFENC